MLIWDLQGVGQQVELEPSPKRGRSPLGARRPASRNRMGPSHPDARQYVAKEHDPK